MLGFIISDLKGSKYEGKVPLDRFTDYIIDGNAISIEEIIKVGHIVRVRGAKLDDK